MSIYWYLCCKNLLNGPMHSRCSNARSENYTSHFLNNVHIYYHNLFQTCHYHKLKYNNKQTITHQKGKRKLSSFVVISLNRATKVTILFRSTLSNQLQTLQFGTKDIALQRLKTIATLFIEYLHIFIC